MVMVKEDYALPSRDAGNQAAFVGNNNPTGYRGNNDTRAELLQARNDVSLAKPVKSNQLGGIPGQLAAATRSGMQGGRLAIKSARQQLEPYQTTGQDALQQQAALLGLSGPEAQAAAKQALFGGEDFLSAQDQSMNALNRQLSATGQLGSGARLAELTKLNAGLREQFLGQRLGQLGSVSGLGFGAASQAAQTELTGGMGIAQMGLQGADQQLQYQLGLMGADAQRAAAKAGAKAQEKAGWMGLAGQVGGAATAALILCDERLKENIEPLGEFNGHKWYEFNYIFDKAKRCIGPMAQEVMKYKPEAVAVHDCGFLMINTEAL